MDGVDPVVLVGAEESLEDEVPVDAFAALLLSLLFGLLPFFFLPPFESAGFFAIFFPLFLLRLFTFWADWAGQAGKDR